MNLNKMSIDSVATRFTNLKLHQCGIFLLALGVGVGFTGCYRSVAPNFYTLTPKITPLVSSNVKLIEVVPVSLPERLNTPLLVLQNSNGQSYMLDNQRWTSSLSNELQSGLSAGLQQKLGAIDVYNTGLTGGKASYTIATEFSRFDIVEHIDKTEVEVMAAWVIKRNESNKLNRQNTGEKEQKEYAQLNCRMSFKNKVIGQERNFLNIVSTYQESLNKIIDAIATSTIAVDEKKVPKIEGAMCS